MKFDDIKGESFAGKIGDLPISDFASVAAASLDRCTTGNVATVCDGLTFQTFSYPSFDALIFGFTDVAGGSRGVSTILFADGTFDAFGSYTSIDGSATLTLSAVPEVATWLMLIVGFGLVGSMLRRRRSLIA